MAGYILYSLDASKLLRVIDQPTDAELNQLAEVLRDQLEDFDEPDPVFKSGLTTDELKALVKSRFAKPDWYGDLSTVGKNLWEDLIWELAMEDLEPPIDLGFECESDGVYWDVIEECWKRLGVVPNQLSSIAMSSFGITPLRYTPPQTGPQTTREEFDAQQEQRLDGLNAAQAVMEESQDALLSGNMDEKQLLAKLQASGAGEVADMMRDMMNVLDGDDDEEDLDPFDEDEDEEFTAMHSMHLPEQVTAMQKELESIANEMSQHQDNEVREEFTEELLPTIQKVANEKRVLFIQVDT